MAITRRQSIDALYDAVEAYDLVLTTDAPLSLALNRRLDHPHLGRFAATPRMLASGAFRPRDDRDLFLVLIDETDLSWKHCAYLVEHILSAWDHTGALDGILDYDRYDTPATREAIDVIRDAESAHQALAEEAIDDDLDVAVIGEDQFTALDRSILPEEYCSVNPFDGAAFELPPFHVFDARTDIVDAVIDNITPDTADDIAIVVDRGSPYPSLLESAFDAEGIPYYGGPGFEDDAGLRTFLRLVRTAHADHAVRIEDIRPILAAVGVTVDVEDDKKRLQSLDDPNLTGLQEFCAGIESTSFAAAISQYERWAEQSLQALQTELDRLDIIEEPVTPGTMDDLEFYLDAFDVPVDRDDSGVLLADATAAAYVDRPVVFYLGMDADWTHSIPDLPWIEPDTIDARNLTQFQLLLQNGIDQYYLVQATRGGDPVRPCLYFHDRLDREFETFTDFDHRRQTVLAPTSRRGFDHDPVDCEPESVSMMSQSGLKRFVNCPRDYYFDALLDTPDRDFFRRGNLYHDYAEFAVSHPDLVADIGREHFVDVMVDEMAPFVDDPGDPVVRTEFRHGIEVIDRFLAERPPTMAEYPAYDDPWWNDNTFADRFDETIESPLTERWFTNPSLGGKGLIDLIHHPTELLDYKSGSRNSASKVVSQSAFEAVSDTPNFQAIMYLAQHRRVRPNEELSFVFFHFSDLVDDAVTGDVDLDEALVRVTYYPEPFAAVAPRQSVFETVIGDVASGHDRRKTLEGLGYEGYTQFFTAHPFPAVADEAALLDSAYATTFVETAEAAVGEYKYVRNGAESALKELLGFRDRNYFAPEVDAFETFLADQIEVLNEYRHARFPVGDPNWDRVDNAELIVTDEY